MKASLGYGVVMAAMVVGWAVSIHALPVTKTKKDEYEATSAPQIPDVETALEYERYLKEVVEALESDPDFRKKLDKAAEADIRVSFNFFLYKTQKILKLISDCTTEGSLFFYLQKWRIFSFNNFAVLFF